MSPEPPRRSAVSRLLLPFLCLGAVAVLTALILRSLHAPPQIGLIPLIAGCLWLQRKGYGPPSSRSDGSPRKRRTRNRRGAQEPGQEALHGEHDA